MTREFVHLHVHSEFSLLDGASRIEDLVSRAHELGQPGMALTDHGNMYGIVHFYQKMKEKKLKPILGAELYIAPNGRFVKATAEDRSPNHITVLAKNAKGYRNLVKLTSLGHTEGFYNKPRIDNELIEQHKEGLIILSGCAKGQFGSFILAGEEKKAKELAYKYKELFGDDYYLEMMYHGIPEQKQINEFIESFTKESGIKTIATNDSHYTKHEDARIQDIMLCIQTGAFIDDKDRMKFSSDEFYIKSLAEMKKNFAHNEEALHNTLEVLEKTNVELEIGKNQMPEFPLPDGESPDSHLENIVHVGINKRYGFESIDEQGKVTVVVPPEIKERVRFELEVIKKTGFASYFLIVQDFIDYARRSGIEVGPGRGSAAGSIVSYSIGITSIDPMKYGLLFERFLNPERVSMPDIDIDFCIERRPEVIEYVTKKYGSDHVAQIITFGTMAARAAIRDVGRVKQVPLIDVDKVAKMIPATPDMTIDIALESNNELKTVYEKDLNIKALIDDAKRIEGLVRHASMHAAGVVIAKDTLTDSVPVQLVNETQVISQYSMEDLADLGLLKMDFLGLRNLTMIARAINIIKHTRGETIDIMNIAFDDSLTFQLFCAADTLGIFQLESRGMRGLIKDLKPQRFEEIIALLALYRPGPIESGMVDDFVKRKHGQVEIKYDLPELEPILRETYGVILYQEQVMAIANKIAGYSLAEADVLRRAMGKKKVKEMKEQREKFVAGAVKKGFSEAKGTHLFNLCEKFAGYGFNKSHSASYAVISYQTAYLKANYPVEFMAALLSSISGDTDKVSAYIAECQRMKVRVMPPDVNESLNDFTVVEGGIRFGLAAVKNVGVNAVESIISNRKKDGKYTSLLNFCERVDLRATNKRVIESLVKCGAFDTLGKRASMLKNVSEVMEKANQRQKEIDSNQSSLFGGPEKHKSYDQGKIEDDGSEFSPDELLRMEKEMLGLYISGHPLTSVRDLILASASTRAVDMAEKKEGMPVTVAGILSACRKITTRKKETMMVATLEDLTGMIPLVIFPRSYAKYSTALFDDAILVIKGKVTIDSMSDEKKLICDIIEPIDRDQKKLRSFHINVPTEKFESLNELKEIFGYYKGSEPVYLHMNGKIVKVGEEHYISIDPSIVARVEEILGKDSAWVDLK